jgi:hypothetical protein
MVVCALLAATTCAGSAFGKTPRKALRRVSAATELEAGPAAPSLRWVAGRLPAGGALAENGAAVVHTIQRGETWQSIAERYLELTSVYHEAELAKAIVTENLPEAKQGPKPGMQLRIPGVLPSAPRSGGAERIGLPKDGVVRGLYVRGSTAGAKTFPGFLDRVVAHGMNAIVLDVKDYDGLLTFPSRVPLANESGAVHEPPMRSYARAVRLAHQKGVRVIARVSCFNDQLMSKAHPGMAIRGISGHVYRNGWLDPKNEQAQAYAIDLVKEALDAGVDEIQLDYVRFPVIGMKNIDFGLDTKADPDAKIDVITRFVERVHSVTKGRGVPLSLDVFGVIAFGKRPDLQNLGQDPAELAKHAEYLSAMVYPSHFDPGFMGMEEPGNHPELVGMGVKAMRSGMEERGLDLDKVAKIRPWLQAMRHKSSSYGAGYVQDEIRTGDRAGASGWLLWNPGQVYDVAWRAVQRPRAKRLAEVSAKHSR